MNIIDETITMTPWREEVPGVFCRSMFMNDEEFWAIVRKGADTRRWIWQIELVGPGVNESIKIAGYTSQGAKQRATTFLKDALKMLGTPPANP